MSATGVKMRKEARLADPAAEEPRRLETARDGRRFWRHFITGRCTYEDTGEYAGEAPENKPAIDPDTSYQELRARRALSDAAKKRESERREESYWRPRPGEVYGDLVQPKQRRGNAWCIAVTTGQYDGRVPGEHPREWGGSDLASLKSSATAPATNGWIDAEFADVHLNDERTRTVLMTLAMLGGTAGARQR